MLLVAEVLEGVVGVAVAAVGSLQMMKGIASGEVVGVAAEAVLEVMELLIMVVMVLVIMMGL
ncbi:hypothetical protein HanRHA438_Chr15g0729481 [Helianthus annuus]|nr:hypothetical protein HanRHA438_Chr15g0729481 [Helianthus annuus]